MHSDAALPEPQSQSAAALAEAAQALASSSRLLVLTGAGLSADAGVPTFRGPDGHYADPEVERLASRDGFASQPEAVWDWYRDRREQIANCSPHPGQRALAMLQAHLPKSSRVLVATTNEDDLLERAGVHAVLHVHGNLFDTTCAAGCGWRCRDEVDNSWSMRPCPRCGAPVRPGSVWFGEPVPTGTMQSLEQFAADACLVVGSSSLVQPIAAIPPEMAMAGLPVVELNAGETPLSSIATHSLRGTAAALLPKLVDLLTSQTVRSQSTIVGKET